MNADSIISKQSKFYGDRLAEGGFELTKNISIYLNANCNFDCSYCIAKSRRNYLQDMPLESIEKFISKVGSTKIDLSVLGGEPFLHKDIYKILDRLGTLNIGDFVLLSNGTIPIKEFHPVLYSLTYHDEQMTERAEAVFLKNCQNICAHNKDLLIELTFMSDKSRRFFKKLQECGLDSYVRQLTINGNTKETLAKNVHCDYYYYNNRKLSYKDVLRFKLNKFAGWKCAATHFNLISDRITDNCNLVNCSLEDFDFEKDYILECKRSECSPECMLEGLKFKEATNS